MATGRPAVGLHSWFCAVDPGAGIRILHSTTESTSRIKSSFARCNCEVKEPAVPGRGCSHRPHTLSAGLLPAAPARCFSPPRIRPELLALCQNNLRRVYRRAILHRARSPRLAVRAAREDSLGREHKENRRPPGERWGHPRGGGRVGRGAVRGRLPVSCVPRDKALARWKASPSAGANWGRHSWRGSRS
jgi:hypothetical protein